MLKYHCNVDSYSICDHAFDGKQALEAVQRNVEKNKGHFCEYELILMDCNMPIMDGFDGTNQIRSYLCENRLSQPIISAITGYSEKSVAKLAIKFGANQVITKPVDPSTINKLIERFIFQKVD